MRRPGPVEYEIYLINVDADSCDGCGTCAFMCATDVFTLQDGLARPLRPENCLNCGGCVGACPSQAITIVEI